MLKKNTIKRNAQWLKEYPMDYLMNLDMKELMLLIETGRELDYTYMSKGYDLLIQNDDDTISFNKAGIMALAHRLGSLANAWSVAKRFKTQFEAQIEGSLTTDHKKWRNAMKVVHTDKTSDPHAEALAKLMTQNKQEVSDDLLDAVELYKKIQQETNRLERERLELQQLLDLQVYSSYLTKQEYLTRLDMFSASTSLPKAEYMSELQFAVKSLDIFYA